MKRKNVTTVMAITLAISLAGCSGSSSSILESSTDSGISVETKEDTTENVASDLTTEEDTASEDDTEKTTTLESEEKDPEESTAEIEKTEEETTEKDTETESETERDTEKESVSEKETEKETEDEAEVNATTPEETTQETTTTQAETTTQATTPAETTTTPPETTTQKETEPEKVVPVSIEASVNGTHEIGKTLGGGDFTIKVKMSDGSVITNPAGWSAAPLTLSSASNVITVSYQGISTKITVNAVQPHTHTYGEWTVTKAATCNSDGENTRTCSGCGNTEKQGIPATGVHTFGEWVVSKQPTATESGFRYQECSGCGLVNSTGIAALGYTQEQLTQMENELMALMNADRVARGEYDTWGNGELWYAGDKWREYARLRAYEQTIKEGHRSPDGYTCAIMQDINEVWYVNLEGCVGYSTSWKSAQDIWTYIKGHASSHYAILTCCYAEGVAIGLYHDPTSGKLYVAIEMIYVRENAINHQIPNCPEWNESTFTRG